MCRRRNAFRECELHEAARGGELEKRSWRLGVEFLHVVSQVSSEVAGGLTTTITIRNKILRNENNVVPSHKNECSRENSENFRSRDRQVGQNDSGLGRPNSTSRNVAEDDRRCVYLSTHLMSSQGKSGPQNLIKKSGPRITQFQPRKEEFLGR